MRASSSCRYAARYSPGTSSRTSSSGEAPASTASANASIRNSFALVAARARSPLRDAVRLGWDSFDVSPLGRPGLGGPPGQDRNRLLALDRLGGRRVAEPEFEQARLRSAARPWWRRTLVVGYRFGRTTGRSAILPPLWRLRSSPTVASAFQGGCGCRVSCRQDDAERRARARPRRFQIPSHPVTVIRVARPWRFPIPSHLVTVKDGGSEHEPLR
jgi:hypothetical protein